MRKVAQTVRQEAELMLASVMALQVRVAAKCLAWVKRCLTWSRFYPGVSRTILDWGTLAGHEERTLPLTWSRSYPGGSRTFLD
jgi:hypothetical protein